MLPFSVKVQFAMKKSTSIYIAQMMCIASTLIIEIEHVEGMRFRRFFCASDFGSDENIIDFDVWINTLRIVV